MNTNITVKGEHPTDIDCFLMKVEYTIYSLTTAEGKRDRLQYYDTPNYNNPTITEWNPTGFSMTEWNPTIFCSDIVIDPKCIPNTFSTDDFFITNLYKATYDKNANLLENTLIVVDRIIDNFYNDLKHMDFFFMKEEMSQDAEEVIFDMFIIPTKEYIRFSVPRMPNAVREFHSEFTTYTNIHSGANYRNSILEHIKKLAFSNSLDRIPISPEVQSVIEKYNFANMSLKEYLVILSI